MQLSKKIILSITFAALSVGAHAKISAGKSYGDWKGVCEQGHCGVVQEVENDKKEPVGRILLRKVPEANNKVVAFITVPLGVNLRAGLGLAVDSKEIAVIPYEFCDPSGCNAALPLEGEVLQAIKAGKLLQVAAFLAGNQGGMAFSLKGVTSAINNL